MTTNTAYNSKIVLLGETGVGKSSISARFVQDTFSEYLELTIGAAYMTKKVTRPSHTVKFDIWDTAGQERYSALVPLYYRGAHVALVVYDIGNAETYDRAKIWIARVKRDHPTCLMYLIGNKSDKSNLRQMHERATHKYATDNGLFFMEVSAKSGKNIPELFNQIADKIPSLPPIPTTTHQSIMNDNEEYSWSSCCYGT